MAPPAERASIGRRDGRGSPALSAAAGTPRSVSPPSSLVDPREGSRTIPSDPRDHTSLGPAPAWFYRRWDVPIVSMGAWMQLALRKLKAEWRRTRPAILRSPEELRTQPSVGPARVPRSPEGLSQRLSTSGPGSSSGSGNTGGFLGTRLTAARELPFGPEGNDRPSAIQARGDSDAERANAGRSSDSGQARNAGSASGCFPMARTIVQRGSIGEAGVELSAHPDAAVRVIEELG